MKIYHCLHRDPKCPVDYKPVIKSFMSLEEARQYIDWYRRQALQTNRYLITQISDDDQLSIALPDLFGGAPMVVETVDIIVSEL